MQGKNKLYDSCILIFFQNLYTFVLLSQHYSYLLRLIDTIKQIRKKRDLNFEAYKP